MDGDEENGAYDGQTGGFDDLREFERDMRLHVIMLRVLRIRRVQVEPGPCTHTQTHRAQVSQRLVHRMISLFDELTSSEVPIVVLALDPRATG